jgi:uncharacterized membrane protein YoaK (UPF0700 family)
MSRVRSGGGRISWRIRTVVLALSFAGGTVDAGAYLGLGHVFPANMTGNTVLLAIAVARGGTTDLARVAAALAAYCAGAFIGTLVLHRRGSWPGKAVPALLVEAGLLAVLVAVWAALGSGPHFGLVALAAAAMGSQSAAVRASHVGGVSTTYVTGTLTTAVARAAWRLRGTPPQASESPALPGEAWILYLFGALAGAFAERAWQAPEMAIGLGLVIVVVLSTRRGEG